MARLPGDHSQVGWLPPSYVHYHFSGTPQPRSRRENFGDFGCGTTFSGSSPLTRGKPVAVFVDAVPRGLIPAHAGKTKTSPPLEPVGTAHPRSRGENEIARAEDVNQNGSSPLTRGKQVQPRAKPRDHGLIPAHTGKTAVPERALNPGTAHPRSRGENGFSPFGWPAVKGSSPLTRGKRGENFVAAHPRSRGENLGTAWIDVVPSGSSPLTRGKLRISEGFDLFVRLIPAHAGKTPRPKRLCARTPAHPRSRGENCVGRRVR